MMKTFARYLSGGSALELGCHEGESTVLLAEILPDLTVVEASSDAIAVARSRAPTSVKFINSTIEAAELQSQYDAIFLINTLEHIESTDLVLSKIRGWLKPRGQFFVLVPNADAPSRQIAVMMGIIDTNNSVTAGEWAHGHRRTYSFDTLEADLRRNGFRIKHRGGLMFKALANFQIDLALKHQIIDDKYIEAIYQLGEIYPTFCASIYLVAECDSQTR